MQRKCFMFLVPGSSVNGLCRHCTNVSPGTCEAVLAAVGTGGLGSAEQFEAEQHQPRSHWNQRFLLASFCYELDYVGRR